MAKLNTNSEDQDWRGARTPAPKKAQHAFPTFTPTRTRMTRSTAKASGAIPLLFELPMRSKTTKIPAGVSLEQIPNPGNLKAKKRGAIRKTDFDDLAVDLGGMDLGKGKGNGEKKGNKTKGKEKAVDQEHKGDEELAKTTRSIRLTLADSIVNKKTPNSMAADADEDSDSNTDPLDPHPILPPSLKSIAQPIFPPKKSPSKHLPRSKLTSPTKRTRTTSRPASPTQTLLSTLAPFSTRKKLWETTHQDVDALGAVIAKGGEGVEVLEGMLDVVRKFWQFRDSLDGYLEEVEGLGLGLVWDRDGEGEEDESDGGEE
ncbi:hypothetical protein BDU57DRAFT_531853 [Ampelomyces quisqualis]|uniref:Uncharacterized protein n=1 Tax=Ampelomyces quisqualis TaxID=50730 RepID=A0A6A5QGU4_AMPQU|nr:hypothetical protein BDU57DRAFT_531853 [Ampelomyces quisqualis]